jgi:hypothetical protein
MRVGYHGTSLESAQGILKEGYRNDTTMFWSVSTGNMHVFDPEFDYAMDKATNQAISAAVVSPSLRRAIVVVDISKKKLKEDRFCNNYPGAFEIEEKVKPEDIVAIYADMKPLNPFIRVIHKIALKKMHKRDVFNYDILNLTEEEEEIYNLIHEVKTEPNYKKLMKIIYSRDDNTLMKKYITTNL